MTTLAIILLVLALGTMLWVIFKNSQKHSGMCGMMPIPYDPDVHGEMDPGLISGAVAFQTGEMVVLNQSGPNEWTLQSASMSAVGETPAAAYKKYMEKYYEGKAGIRK